MNEPISSDDVELIVAASDGQPLVEVLAWEQIEPGRYQPRRIRGSFRGRKLG
jgi:hypothetical protein